jgi:hypothetical protein
MSPAALLPSKPQLMSKLVATDSRRRTACPLLIFASFERWSGETLSVADADQLSRKELKTLAQRKRPLATSILATRFPINSTFNRKIILW